MTLHNKRRGRKLLYILIGLVAALTLAAWFRRPMTPDGLYYAKNFSPTTYLQFKDGKLRFTTTDEEREISDRFIETRGTYALEGNEWILRGPPGEHDPEVILKPSLFGLKMICRKEEYPQWNRFLPRRGFAWLESLGVLPSSAPNASHESEGSGSFR